MTNKESVILRAHHGMCFYFFQGKGYSDDFTKNMSELKSFLDTIDPYVKVVAHDDAVCKNCPNLRRNTNNQESDEFMCISADKVSGYDRAVLEALNLKENTVLKYSEFSKMVQENIIKKGFRTKICGDCMWNSICICDKINRG